jgi:hypothetical protein
MLSNSTFASSLVQGKPCEDGVDVEEVEGEGGEEERKIEREKDRNRERGKREKERVSERVNERRRDERE